MTVPAPSDIGAELEGAILQLNNSHATELSLLDLDRLRLLLGQAFYARAIGQGDAFLLALNEHAEYDSPNYAWFQARFERFIYVDRVAVAPWVRGRGLAKRLYIDLIARAADIGHEVVTCEINSSPPNPASDAFHAALGFAAVGEAIIHGGTKKVRYHARRIRAPSCQVGACQAV